MSDIIFARGDVSFINQIVWRHCIQIDIAVLTYSIQFSLYFLLFINFPHFSSSFYNSFTKFLCLPETSRSANGSYLLADPDQCIYFNFWYFSILFSIFSILILLNLTLNSFPSLQWIYPILRSTYVLSIYLSFYYVFLLFDLIPFPCWHSLFSSRNNKFWLQDRKSVV